MPDRNTSIKAVVSFLAIIGVMALVVLFVSPTPMPPANSQLFGVLVGLLSAAGFTLLTLFAGSAAHGQKTDPPKPGGSES